MLYFRPRTGLLLSIALCVALLACSSKGRDKVQQSSLIPDDESTDTERETIVRTLGEIEALAAELGQPQSFRSIPVVVTSEDMMKARRAGACVRQNGKPKLIVVNRRVLELETTLKDLGVETALFRVLLHEIGHCYLGREHTGEQIHLPRRKVVWHRDTGVFPETVTYPALNVSSMEANSITMPVVLKKYYVAELLGIARAKELSDFSAYARFEYTEEEEDRQ